MAQIQKGTTYSTGDQVTATNLNALADAAILLPGAITDQTAKTVPLAADTVLIHSAADTALRKSTLTQLFSNATGIPISTGISGLGTGIATALAVNTGSAGAPVLFNGALGTPASGTVTNLTGTASININGTVGATTASTGAFTTLSATGTISHLLSANSGVTGFSSQNSNAGTSAYLLSSLNNGTNLLNSYILGVNWSGTFLTGGPATQSAGIYTSANIPISIGINNAEVARFTSTGLAVTGALSATGNISTSGNGGFFNSGSIPIGFSSDSASSGNTFLDIYRVLNIRNTNASYATLGTWSATGLAVTGTLSTTGNVTLSSGVSLRIFNAANNDDGIWYNTGGSGVSILTARISGVDRVSISSTGLAVTGQIAVGGSTIAASIRSTFTGNTIDGISLLDSADQSNTDFAVFRKANSTAIGSIRRVTTTDAVAYNTTSDGRLKENLRDFTDSGRLIDSLKPRVFDWKNSDENGKNVIGFIAQEEHAADPIFAHIGAVSVGDEDPDTVTKQWQRSDAALIPILVAELKALRQRVAALENS
jgi:hypothetical protein